MADMKLIIGSKIGVQRNEMNHYSIPTKASASLVRTIPKLHQVVMRMKNTS